MQNYCWCHTSDENFSHNIEIRAVEDFLSRKGVLHAPLLEQSEWDGEHVFEGQEAI